MAEQRNPVMKAFILAYTDEEQKVVPTMESL